ncbi:FAD:protein FMN transferase [Mesobacterium sp. TK19101]|uniref:FAD:protein FMN transferase n=1 Tax=Mesobacterium hydrothermale TaxID=3111907 RepID=A0ABU6HH06_9RHOB|nr:FAD:protein FMN transferase [Mesobacterium sp. TK19101]MEC3861739.1 FAD:protein FMN transferase [Mesobacterium sp. TK19101]
MTLTRRRFLTLSAAALALPADAAPLRWQGYALGAEVALTLHAPAPQAKAALTAVRAVLTHIEQQFSLYDPGSALSRLNRDGRLARPDPDFAALMHLCDDLHLATADLFDPSVQPMWQALARGDSVPDVPDWTALRQDATGIRLAPGQALTFNGIAQGYATDLARACLVRHGLTRALVNIGEFAALGGPFRLGVADPAGAMLAVEPLTNRARATSSPGAMVLNSGTPHILDPKGQRQPLWSTVSVEADSAAVADAASTAFCLMSETEIDGCLSRLPGQGARVLLVDATGRITRIG